MPRTSKDPLEKVTLNLVKGDKETLAAFHPQLGWSVACREIIKRYCEELRLADSKIERRAIEIDLSNLEPAQ